MLPQILRLLGPLVLRKLGSKQLANGPSGAIIQAKAAEILGVIAAATGVAAICLSWIPILNILSLIPAVLAIAAGGYALYVGRHHRFKRSWAFAGVLAGIVAFVIIFYSNDWLIGKFRGNDNDQPNTEEVRTDI
jgi:ABC-type transport system involved in cytochrome c biogenesis permease subunit